MSVVFDAVTADAPVRSLELFVEALDVGEQLQCLVVASELGGAGRRYAVEERDSVRSVEFLGDPAWRELHAQAVEPAHDSASLVADVDVALGQ